MAVAALVALRGLKGGVQQDTEGAATGREGEIPGGEADAAYRTLR